MFRKILPHAAIIISMMYVTFWLIDRVNSAMTLIDHGMTKGLLLILMVLSALTAVIHIAEAQLRNGRFSSPAAAGTSYMSVALSAVYLILFLIDCCSPNGRLFSGEFVKFILLLWVIGTILESVLLIILDRTRARRPRTGRKPVQTGRRPVRYDRYR